MPLPVSFSLLNSLIAFWMSEKTSYESYEKKRYLSERSTRGERGRWIAGAKHRKAIQEKREQPWDTRAGRQNVFLPHFTTEDTKTHIP